MNRINEINTERKTIEQQNKSIRQRMKKKRQMLEEYLKQAEEYAYGIKQLEEQMSRNLDKYYKLGEELQQLTGEKRVAL